MKKILSTILIITFILSLSFGILIPKKAKAIFGIGDITVDIIAQLKEWGLDQIPKTMARQLMVRIQQEIARWAQGGFSDENKPFAMTSWKDELDEAFDVATGRFIQEQNLTALCPSFKVGLNAILGLNQFHKVPYTQYAACTLDTIIDNVEKFIENPSIAVYGWDSWTALSQPQNNIYGSYLLAVARQAQIQDEEKEAKDKEIQAGGGFKNETICSKTDQEECQATCAIHYPALVFGLPNPDLFACVSACERSSIGVCIEKETLKIGSDIKTGIDKIIGSDMDWLITADEITEMINIVFSGLLTKLVHGTGLSTKPFYKATVITQNQLEYGYYDAYQLAMTEEEYNKTKTSILNNILDTIKRISTTSWESEPRNQLVGDVFSELAGEIIDQEAQHLYVAREGVDLKPDFIVLDNSMAVANGVALYGLTWDQISFDKYPSKCASISNKRCSEILTNLPYELDLNNINSECTTGCLSKINEYREQEFSDSEAISKAVSDRICSTIARGQACLSGAKLIDRTKKRCTNCVSNAQKICEFKTNIAEKNQCIENYCNNYEDISSSIRSSQDFYDRCNRSILKNSCHVCLKEYFMPADYCLQVADYVNRAFVKYPAQVKDDLWWGRFIQAKSDSKSKVPSNAAVEVSLVCRIFPDFVFGTGKTCTNYCNVTKDELKNITDNKPTEIDCNQTKLDFTAYSPGSQYLEYLAIKQTKCCGGLVGYGESSGFGFNNPNTKSLYEKCRGLKGDIFSLAPPTPPMPPTVCYDNDEPTTPNENEKGYAALTNMSVINKAQGFIDVIWYSQAYADHVILRSNREPFRGAEIYITEPYCDARRVYPNGNIYESDTNGDGVFSEKFEDDQAFIGEFLGFCKNTNGTYKNPPADKIVCKFDLDVDGNGTKSFKDCADKLKSYSPPTKQGRTDKGGLWIVVRYPQGGAELCVKKD
ncbi:hypothetical protein KKA23_01990 [Patescibacteria group bacterium]|nr:hypothetical protein [Patescibacteria group bacterium]